MTAFARAGSDSLVWEIRSVNHRYLELAFRLPEQLRALEPSLRDIARKRLSRGKVDVTLRLGDVAGHSMDVDAAAVEALLAAMRGVHNEAPELEQPNLLDVLRWPGVLVEDGAALDQLGREANATFVEAVDSLAARREAEGAGLRALLEERIEAAEGIVARVRDLAASQSEAMRRRLQRAVDDLELRVARDRLDQELALLLQKADVAEELDRLGLHLADARQALAGDVPCGRRLDFLMQELNREANTLASKAVLPDASGCAVDLKVAIEQMREQVQNIE